METRVTYYNPCPLLFITMADSYYEERSETDTSNILIVICSFSKEAALNNIISFIKYINIYIYKYLHGANKA